MYFETNLNVEREHWTHTHTHTHTHTYTHTPWKVWKNTTYFVKASDNIRGLFFRYIRCFLEMIWWCSRILMTNPIQILTVVVLNNSAGLTVFLHIRWYHWLIGFMYPNKTNIFIKCWRQLVLLSCIYYCIEFFVLLALNKINEIKKRIFYSKHDFIGLSNQNTKY